MADVELVSSHSDGQYLHAAELRNIWLAAGGAGVSERSITASLTGADRIITVPAFSARVPDGNGGVTSVNFAGGTAEFDAGDNDHPRKDALVLDADGNLSIRTGTPTEITGNVEDPPVPPLGSDEILLAVVDVAATATTVSAAHVHGRAAVSGGGGGGLGHNVEVFEASGTFDATQVPFSGDGGRWVFVEMWGGGGGGGRGGSSSAYASGGGGGGYRSGWVDTASVSSIAVTVGTGGAGATSLGSTGSAGGNSSFGSLMSVGGGNGGGSSSSFHAAGGGAGSGAGVGIEGQRGGAAGSGSSSPKGGDGGDAPRGGPGGQGGVSGVPATPGIVPGGGGAAGQGFASDGASAGAAGRVIVSW